MSDAGTDPRLCLGCGADMDARRSHAKTCSSRCRQKVRRLRARGVEPGPKGPKQKAEDARIAREVLDGLL